MNFTGPEGNQLKIGTCEHYLKEGLPHGGECTLTCDPERTAQLQADLFLFVNLDVVCEDGRITEHPLKETWCSKESYMLPSVCFLITVTVAAGVAGYLLEKRQGQFEADCQRALAINIPAMVTPKRTKSMSMSMSF